MKKNSTNSNFLYKSILYIYGDIIEEKTTKNTRKREIIDAIASYIKKNKDVPIFSTLVINQIRRKTNG